MRVLHILNELRPSGAETMLLSAAGFWASRGIQGEILSTGESPGEYAESLRAAGYRIHHLPFLPTPGFLAGVYRFFRRLPVDRVHIHCERANFWYAVLAHLAGCRHITRTVHNTFGFHGALRLRRFLQRWILRRWVGVRSVAVGPSVQKVEWQTYRNPTLPMLNWFDDVRFRPPSGGEREAARAAAGIAPGALAVITVGNCSVVKNHSAVIEALALLPPGIDVLYLHAGCEEEGCPERCLAARLKVHGRIRFLGPVRDVAPLLQAADLFLMPSLHEGLPIAAVEAMGAGLPVVLADVDGLRDLWEIAPAAFRAAPEAGPIADAILRFHQLREPVRTEIGRALSARIRQHCSVAVGAARYAGLYEEARPS